MKSKLFNAQLPFCPGSEHNVIVVVSLCPAGSYWKAGKLTIWVPPIARLRLACEPLQPLRLTKPSADTATVLLLVVSVTIMLMDWKSVAPVFVNEIFAHQPVSAQLCMELYDASKFGTGPCVEVGRGVGVGGGVSSGRVLIFPVTVAN